jgi:hypothetical protein
VDHDAEDCGSPDGEAPDGRQQQEPSTSDGPSAAGVVTSVIVDPVVGELVSAGGDALVARFERRFR